MQLLHYPDRKRCKERTGKSCRTRVSLTGRHTDFMHRIWIGLLWACVIPVFMPVQCHAEQEPASLKAEDVASSFSGNISWYGPHFQGHRTASGDIFDTYKLTAAHRTLSFHTSVLVEDPRSGNAVIVKVNDRGPFVGLRVMDVTMAAAKRLGIVSRGLAYVDCLVIKGNKN